MTAQSKQGPRSLMKTSGLATREAPIRRPGTALPPAPAKTERAPTGSRTSRFGGPQSENRRACCSCERRAGQRHHPIRFGRRTTPPGHGANCDRRRGSRCRFAGNACRCQHHLRNSPQARERADVSRRRTEALQRLITDSSNQIGAWANNIKQNGERQACSVVLIEKLSQQAASIGDVTKTVGHVSDQTNLLALNAAIEAARAGDHGRVSQSLPTRSALSPSPRRKAPGTPSTLATKIQDEVKSVSALIKNAADASAARPKEPNRCSGARGASKGNRRAGEGKPIDRNAALQAEGAAREAQKGAEIISSAAEEQAAAAAEALRSVEQQSRLSMNARARPKSVANC